MPDKPNTLLPLGRRFGRKATTILQPTEPFTTPTPMDLTMLGYLTTSLLLPLIKVYISQDNKDYAVVSAESEGEMPVGFKANENGIYTLTVSSPLNSHLSTLTFRYLHLIDNLTGNDIDLLQTPSYSFEAKTTDYESRFKLVFSAQQGGEETEDGFAFISNGEIIINGEGTLQVMDVMGRILVSVDGRTRCVPTNGMTAGVYVLRLINGDKVKTQKMVID